MLKQLIAFHKMNLLELLEYKGSFILGSIATLFSIGVSMAFIWVIFSFAQSINGWNVYQTLFISSLGALSFGLWKMFFTGVYHLETNIRRGWFDGILVSPLNPLFYLLAKYLEVDGVVSLFAALAVIAYAWANLGIQWSLFNILLLVVFALSGSIILLSVTLIGATISFWTTRANAMINMLIHPFNFVSYPLEIYSHVIVFVLSFVLPFAFVTYYPAQAFLGKGSYLELAFVSPIVALVAFTAAHLFWRVGVRYYTSTGS